MAFAARDEAAVGRLGPGRYLPGRGEALRGFAAARLGSGGLVLATTGGDFFVFVSAGGSSGLAAGFRAHQCFFAGLSAHAST